MREAVVKTESVASYEQYWYRVEGSDHTLIDVKACHDAHIILTESVQNFDKVYEIALGINRNEESQIRQARQSGAVVVVDTPDILHCNESRMFWIRWADTRIAVGSGAVVGVGQFMDWQRESPPNILYVGLQTGWSASGEWTIRNVEGNYDVITVINDVIIVTLFVEPALTYITPSEATSSYNQVWMTPVT